MSLAVKGTERILDAALLAEAATLVPQLESKERLNPVSMTNVTVGWQAWDLWKVDFEEPVYVVVYSGVLLHC